MSIEALKDTIPDYAKDIKLNLSSLATDETLSPAQLWGTFLATALATKNDAVIQAIQAEATNHMTEEEMTAAKAAASIMAMTNIYYRFLYLSSDPVYQTLPAKLRMSIIAKPGVDAVDFDLWCTAVSVINGCGACIDSHEKKLRSHGVSSEQVQTSVRIASVIHAVSAIISGEQAMRSDLAQAA